MWFSSGKGRLSDPKHIRRARAYLEEARMAMLEHSVAAEHYKSMTSMYAQRVRRLEQEIAEWEVQRLGKGAAASDTGPETEIAPVAVSQPVPAPRQWPQTAGVVMPLPGGEVPPDPHPSRGGHRHAA